MSTPEDGAGAVRRSGTGSDQADDPALRQPEVAVATRRRRNLSPWNVLLLAPFIGVLVPGWYNHATPRLFGLPFFYWWQLAWIAVAVLVLLVVYVATRGAR